MPRCARSGTSCIDMRRMSSNTATPAAVAAAPDTPFTFLPLSIASAYGLTPFWQLMSQGPLQFRTQMTSSNDPAETAVNSVAKRIAARKQRTRDAERWGRDSFAQLRPPVAVSCCQRTLPRWRSVLHAFATTCPQPGCKGRRWTSLWWGQ